MDDDKDLCFATALHVLSELNIITKDEILNHLKNKDYNGLRMLIVKRDVERKFKGILY